MFTLGILNAYLIFVRLCEDIDIKNANDVSNLYSSLAGNFENVVQYNKDNREFEVGFS